MNKLTCVTVLQESTATGAGLQATEARVENAMAIALTVQNVDINQGLFGHKIRYQWGRVGVGVGYDSRLITVWLEK